MKNILNKLNNLEPHFRKTATKDENYSCISFILLHFVLLLLHFFVYMVAEKERFSIFIAIFHCAIFLLFITLIIKKRLRYIRTDVDRSFALLGIIFVLIVLLIQVGVTAFQIESRELLLASFLGIFLGNVIDYSVAVINVKKDTPRKEIAAGEKTMVIAIVASVAAITTQLLRIINPSDEQIVVLIFIALLILSIFTGIIIFDTICRIILKIN